MCPTPNADRFDLIRIREQAGLSLRALAGRIGTSYSHLSDVERGRYKVTCGMWERVVRAVGQAQAGREP